MTDHDTRDSKIRTLSPWQQRLVFGLIAWTATSLILSAFWVVVVGIYAAYTDSFVLLYGLLPASCVFAAYLVWVDLDTLPVEQGQVEGYDAG